MNRVRTAYERPGTVVGAVLAAIFLTEFTVMLVLDLLAPGLASWAKASINAAVLSLTVSGVILWAFGESRQPAQARDPGVASRPGQDAPSLAGARAWGQFGLLFAVIFATNAIVTLLLKLAPMTEHRWQEPLLHAVGSTVPIAGAIWWLVVTPIERAAAQVRRMVPAVTEAQERLQLALEGSGMVLWDADVASAGVVLSERWAELSGAPPGETHTTVNALVALMHPGDRQRVVDEAILVVKGARPEYSVEHRVRIVTGEWRWMLSRGRVTERGADGRVKRMSGTNVDITERRKMEDALRESEAQYKAVIEAALDAIIVNDGRGRITEFNPAAERTFGFRRAEVLGQALAELLIPGNDSGAHRQQFADELARGVPAFDGRRVEVSALHADGHEFPIELVVRRIDRDVGVFFTAFARDITARKQMEESLARQNRLLEAANRAKSEFMANVTHELRTPLNAIIGFSEMLKDEVPGPLNAKQAAFAADIAASSEHLLALVEAILEMSRLDAPGGAIEREPLEIGAALAERAAAQRKVAAARGIEIRLDVAPDTGSAAVEPKALCRMLDALLDNAVKFNRDGGTVTVRARRADGALEITVADTGIGIAKEDLAKLFRPLAQLDAGLARRHGGVGLGLALARRLAELHGGTIDVQSEPGEGSAFALRLPTKEMS